MLSRARSAFVGLALGDALGAPAEFLTSGEITSRYGRLDDIVGGGWLRLKPGEVTDDTQMSLCIARATVAAGGWSLTGIADSFAAWLRSKPVDVGETCRRGIRRYMLKGELEAPFNQWDAGNGAVMRMLPTALFCLGDATLLEQCALSQARLTHNHPLSDAACITFGRLIHLALLGFSKNRLKREVDTLIQSHPSFSFDHYRGLATGYVVDTLQTVFHHFFISRSFEECVVGTVNQGGDADTTGAIAGALAGAYYGEAELPKRWLKKMDRRLVAELERLAEDLVKLSPLFSQDKEVVGKLQVVQK
ncbi:ADP-ribosyl-[dinitrogen reductase] hydrolase [Geobacter sp. DSM 9736]|nr:ADP-ribosyl-[dinitrogen reductase] hydrolase [Geobacter sp. DSM 9736]